MSRLNVISPERIDFVGADRNTMVGDRWCPANPRGSVLFLHGGGQTRHSWARTAERLAAAGWTAITVDARGHGDSAWTAQYRLDDFVADLREILDQLETPRAVVGASLGGRTILTAEGENPSMCSAVALVDIAPNINRAEQQRVQSFLGAAPDGFRSLDEAAAAIDAYRPGGTKRNPQGLRKNLRQRDDGRWYWHWDPKFLEFGTDPENSSTERLNRAASGISVPTLLVRGTRSGMVSADSAADLMNRIPHGELAEVDAGHMITGDDNGVFTERLTTFFDEHAASRRNL
ncbi:MAG: alpha/beta hydrolase [Rhodococcus sp. (in: high G+C Gram-positive bacteria)]|nr:MAG: alpha/beta hydrolase [Rhodococcus sp. (in: high G+C Gram-positive bacteria)]